MSFISLKNGTLPLFFTSKNHVHNLHKKTQPATNAATEFSLYKVRHSASDWVKQRNIQMDAQARRCNASWPASLKISAALSDLYNCPIISRRDKSLDRYLFFFNWHTLKTFFVIFKKIKTYTECSISVHQHRIYVFLYHLTKSFNLITPMVYFLDLKQCKCLYRTILIKHFFEYFEQTMEKIHELNKKNTLLKGTKCQDLNCGHCFQRLLHQYDDTIQGMT